MVEAAILYPITVLCMLTLLWSMISMYSQVAASTDLHLALSLSAAEESGTRLYDVSYDGGTAAMRNRGIEKFIEQVMLPEIGEKHGLIRKKLRGKHADRAIAYGIIRHYGLRDYEDEIYVIDEEKEIRCFDAASGILKEAVP